MQSAAYWNRDDDEASEGDDEVSEEDRSDDSEVDDDSDDSGFFEANDDNAGSVESDDNDAGSVESDDDDAGYVVEVSHVLVVIRSIPFEEDSQLDDPNHDDAPKIRIERQSDKLARERFVKFYQSQGIEGIKTDDFVYSWSIGCHPSLIVVRRPSSERENTYFLIIHHRSRSSAILKLGISPLVPWHVLLSVVKLPYAFRTTIDWLCLHEGHARKLVAIAATSARITSLGH